MLVATIWDRSDFVVLLPSSRAFLSRELCGKLVDPRIDAIALVRRCNDELMFLRCFSRPYQSPDGSIQKAEWLREV